MRAALLLACLGCALVACSSDDTTPAAVVASPSSTATTVGTTTATSAPAGPFGVTTEDRTLTGDDPPLDVRIWAPEGTGSATRKLIVLAHGLAGEPDKFDELTTTWAEAGYVVAAPRFPGSSASGGARVDGFDQQPAMVSSVIDQLTADPDLRLDPDHVGVAGLSLGGSTTYALTTDPCCVDGRIDAAAIFDGLRPGAFGDAPLEPNRVPVLVMHCDQDFVLPYQEHTVMGFERLVGPSWLVTMPCLEHSQPYEDDPSAFDGLVEDVTLALWDSTLGGDPGRADQIVADVEADGRGTVRYQAP